MPAQFAGGSRRSATTGATRWWRRSAGSTRTSSAAACCSAARRSARTSAPAASRAARCRRPSDALRVEDPPARVERDEARDGDGRNVPLGVDVPGHERRDDGASVACKERHADDLVRSGSSKLGDQREPAAGRNRRLRRQIEDRAACRREPAARADDAGRRGARVGGGPAVAAAATHAVERHGRARADEDGPWPRRRKLAQAPAIGAPRRPLRVPERGGRVGRLLARDRLKQGIAVAGGADGLTIDLHVVVEYGLNLAEVAATIRSRVSYEVERLTGLTVSAVEVHIENVRRSA